MVNKMKGSISARAVAHHDMKYEPINCPNCGRFMEWDAYDEVFSCGCGGSECIKDPNRIGWLTIRKKTDHTVHEYRKAITGSLFKEDAESQGMEETTNG